MKIAIDAHAIGSQAGGNETYFRQLVDALIHDTSEIRYTLFCSHPAASNELRSDPRFDLMRVPSNRLLRISAALPCRLRKLMPDVFHCQYILPLHVPCKTVVTIHDLSHEHFPGLASRPQTMAMRALVRATARRADCILTVSEFCARDIVQTYKVPEEKVHVAYQSVADTFQPRDKGAAQERVAQTHGIHPPFLLYVGRIQARKNLLRLMEAYAHARRRGISPRLVVVGKPDYGAERVFARVDELGLRDSVIFPGYVQAQDLPFFYNAAEAFLFPSLFEGFGLPVLESMASGLPAITSLGSSLEEVAGNAALLVDPGNTDALAEAIVRIVSDNDLRRALTERGLQRAAQFTAESFASHVLKVYRSLM